MSRNLILLLFIVSAYNCNNFDDPLNTINLEKKEMQIGDTIDGWGGDIRLSIIKIRKLEEGKKDITAISSFKGRDVGIELELLPTNEKSSEFHKTGITIKSLGDVSDRLIQVLSNIYGLKADSTLKFAKSLNTTFVDLNAMAAKLGSTEKPQDVETKLFFENSNDENDNGEIFLNINEKEGWVELKEKDIDYRKAVIKALSIK